MNSLKKLALFLTLFFLWGCQSEPQTNNDPSDVERNLVAAIEDFPKLLDRHERIRQGKEWETVQNQYVQNRKAAISGNPEGQLNIALIFMQEARITGEHGHYYPAALQLLDELVDQEINNADLQFRAMAAKAAVLLSQHEFASALQTGLEAVTINPYNAQIYGVLTDAYVEMGNYHKAIEMADKMVAVRPDLRSYARISYLREIHGLYEEAIEAMEMAVEAGYPGLEETSWAQLELGNLYSRYGYADKAKVQYEAILKYRPDYPFAIAAKAQLAFEEKDYQTAEELLKEACSIIPEVGFYEQLAHVYAQTNRTVEKEAILKDIMIMLQEDVESGHNMNLEYANLYIELKTDYKAALQFANRAYEARPNNIDTNRMLARIYAEQGNMQKAKEHLQKATITGSKHPELIELMKAIG